MRYAWLNLVLRLTNRIYQMKQSVIGQEGLSAVGNVFVLIFLETILAVVSLPLYLNLKSKSVTAFLEEEGGYAKIIVDFNLRRILTLSGVGIVLAIWLVKLSLILLVPTIFGELQLYTVSDLRPPDLLSVDTNLINTETEIQTAKITASLVIPELTEVKKNKGQDYIFYGVGQPDSTVVLLLSDLQTAVYTEQVDANGNWEIDHTQSNFSLNEGNHSVLTFTFDRDAATRSEFSDEQYFKVKTTFLDQLVKNVDTLANWSVVAVIIVGIFLTILTI